MIDEWIKSVVAADTADWVTVACYLSTAVLAARAGDVARDTHRNTEKRFWLSLTLLMVLLGINELLDLQSLLTVLGRDYARANGWYGQHRQYQYVFVIALAVLAVIAGIVAMLLTCRMARSVQLALVGLVFIGLFVLLRAASFHHLDDLLGRGPQTFNFGSLQELFGIFVIAVAALLYGRRRAR